MPTDRVTTLRQQSSSSLVPRPSTEASASRAAADLHARTTVGPDQVSVLLAVWCSSVGSTWTLELHEPTGDATLGPLVDWITSDAPTSQSAPDEAAARALLAKHGRRLYCATDAGPRTHSRCCIGYVSHPMPPFEASAVSLRTDSSARDTAHQAAPAEAVHSPRSSSPDTESPDTELWTTERLQALLLRVVRAADIGLLLPEDADWIRAQIRAASQPAPPMTS